MRRASTIALDLIESGYDAPSPAQIGQAFFDALQPYGVRAIYSRAYLGTDPSTEAIYSRISPPGWESFYSDHKFAGINYLAREVARRDQPFAWSDIKLIDPAELRLQSALIEHGFPDGLAAPSHGLGYVGVTSLAFAALGQIAPDERGAIELASMVLHQRMKLIARRRPLSTPLVHLTPRERDCLAFLAEGRTDWQIAEYLGIAETTVMTHIQSIRRKLGARNRTQAVAIGVAAGLVFNSASLPNDR